MQNPAPFANLFLNSRRTKTDAISPNMAHLSNLDIYLIYYRLHHVWIFDEFEIKVLKVCLNIDALKPRIHVFID